MFVFRQVCHLESDAELQLDKSVSRTYQAASHSLNTTQATILPSSFDLHTTGVTKKNVKFPQSSHFILF